MQYKGPLIVVKDMERSKAFYRDILELTVVDDFGANVMLTGNVWLQTADSYASFLNKPLSEIRFFGNDAELYFECDDLPAFCERLEKTPGIKMIHPLLTHSWGQMGVRFYDPDGHIIEVGEPIQSTVQRFLCEGLSAREIAAAMDVPVSYVQDMRNKE